MIKQCIKIFYKVGEYKLKNIKICIGLLTYCPPNNPQKFSVLKKTVDSLSLLKECCEGVHIYVWDNNSSPETKEYLKSKDLFDSYYMSGKNYYDVGAMHFLAEKAKSLNSPYVMHVEDDMCFYNRDFLNDSFSFMEKNKDCGALRVIKYEYDKMPKYDKLSNYPLKDHANAMRHLNWITKESLTWQGPQKFGKNIFYKNNWHWTNFPSVCRTEILDTILPKTDCSPLNKFEGIMMKNYDKLNLSVGVLDGGATTHLANTTTEASMRFKFCSSNNKPLSHTFSSVDYDSLSKQIHFFLRD